MSTALFVLRAIQAGLSLDDLDRIEYGFAVDILIEAGNDTLEYAELATQDDFDAF